MMTNEEVRDPDMVVAHANTLIPPGYRWVLRSSKVQMHLLDNNLERVATVILDPVDGYHFYSVDGKPYGGCTSVNDAIDKVLDEALPARDKTSKTAEIWPEEDDERLAIMSDVHCGWAADYGDLVLRFEAHYTEALSATLVIEGGDAIGDFVRAYKVQDVHDLEGKPVWLKSGEKSGRKWGASCRVKVSRPWGSR